MKDTLTLSTGEVLKLEKPKVRSIRLASKKADESDKMIALIAICTNKTESEVDELELADYSIIRDEIQSFLQSSGFITQ